MVYFVLEEEIKLNWISVFVLSLFFFFSPKISEAFDEKVLASVVTVIPKHFSSERGNKVQLKSRQAPEGTGVAIFEKGFLVTNAHVLGKATSAYIRLENGRLSDAAIVAQDIFTDIALLKVDLDLPVLHPAQSASLGSSVCAIGNQFGLGLSVSCGVISALNRTGVGFNPIEDFIQTDTVVNPGASGGALINNNGQLVGLISAIFTKGSDSNIGVNFATSIDMVFRVAMDLKEFGYVKRGKSGLRVTALSKEKRYNSNGVIINYIKKGGAAFKAGLQEGDIITKIGNRLIIKPTDVSSAFHKYKPLQSITIQYVSKKKRLSTNIRLLP